MFSRVRGQATKSERWMPWRREAMKDVASCDKPRGAASRHRSEDVRMGEPGWGNAHSSVAESIGHGTRTGGTETSQYLEGDRKSTRLNSSHTVISYAVFCLKKKKQAQTYRVVTSRVPDACSTNAT